MNINLNFDKPSVSKGVITLLLENMKSEANKMHLKRVAAGKKLQYGDANDLVLDILNAMYLENSSLDDEISASNPYEPSEDKSPSLEEIETDETLSQHLKTAQKNEHKKTVTG